MSDRKRLTDTAIKNAKPPAIGQAELWDGGLSGFGLRVTAKGVKSFVLLYRHHGRPRRWTLGRYPALSLADARRMASDALTAIEHGRDPAEDNQTAQGGTFAEALETFFDTYCAHHNKASTAAETRRNMRAVFLPAWKGRDLATITRADVLAITDKLMNTDRPSAARHAHSHARKFFAWCVERGLLAHSPMEGLRPPTRAKNRSKTLSLDELRAVMAAADGMGYPFGPIVRLLVLTGQRRAEVAGMAWAELDDRAALWRIPAARTKNGRAHALPLAPVALATVESLPRFGGLLVFPARGNEAAPFSGWSKAKAQLDRLAGLEGWTLHDLRRSMATGCASLGTPPHIVERILNHAGGTFAGVAGVYNRFGYEIEMREALTAWEAQISAIGENPNRAFFGDLENTPPAKARIA